MFSEIEVKDKKWKRTLYSKKYNEMKEKKYSIWDKIAVRMFCPEFQYLTESPKNQAGKSNTSYIFDSIIGYDNIKKTLANTINSNQSISILLSGNAGCGKSLFLKEIEKFYPEESYFIDGSRASKAGIFHVLFDDTENRIRFLLVDELDKLNISDQDALLTLTEDGKLIQTLKTDCREKRYHNLSVICACNRIDDILYPLQTRLFVIPIRDYTEQEFKEIAKKILPEKYDTSIELSNYLASEVWRLSLQANKRPNIRDCIKIVKLSRNDPKMIDMLLDIAINN